jgi:DNA-binding CsgD family transcriptional regulator
VQNGTDFSQLPVLDEVSLRLFDNVLASGGLDRGQQAAGAAAAAGLSGAQLDHATEVLLALRLLRPAPGRPELLIPTNPEAAAAEVVGPLEARIAAASTRAQATRDQLHALMPRYRSALRERGRQAGGDRLPDLTTVSAMLSEEAARCHEEVFTIQPGGGRQPGRLAEAVNRDLAMLDRGIRMRTLYQHSARSNLATQGYVESLTAAGAEYRTAAELPDRAVVFDRAVAFLPARAEDGSGEAAVLVRDPDIVSYLCRVFDQLWATATPFTGSSEAAYRAVGDDLRRALLGMLAGGDKDEVIARRLGMSLRTCRRHIADAMLALGAESRFQGGVLAERSGLIAAAPAVG